MDAKNKALKLTAWLEAMERGELTAAEVREKLLAAGCAKAEADEILAIANGGSDLVQEDPE